MGPGPDRIDYEALAARMAALGYPMRLEILHALRLPHALKDIRVAPQRTGSATAARQTIERHVRRLEEAGLVRRRDLDVGRTRREFAVDPQQMWAFSEQVRRLSSLYAGRGLSGKDTRSAPALAPGTPTRPREAHLVVVHGLYEGQTNLLPAVGTATIGRGNSSDIDISYDPYTSSRHAEIGRDPEGWWIKDLGSRNGTTVNWVPLSPNHPQRLETADVIGVGRSFLCARL